MSEGTVNIKRNYRAAPDWHWKVRIYAPTGQYSIGQLKTERDLKIIDAIQDFYLSMTGCKMLLEGMGEQEFDGIQLIDEAFETIWENRA